MPQRTWLIMGVSSGFGHEITRQLLDHGDRVVGTVRDTRKVADLVEHYSDTFPRHHRHEQRPGHERDAVPADAPEVVSLL